MSWTGNYVLGNGNMTVISWYTNMWNERTNTHWDVLAHIPTLWCYEKNIPCNVASLFYNHSVVMHLVSGMLIS